MLKRVSAIAFIFICSSVAWMILAASISARTYSSDDKLQPGIASTWGSPQQQLQPVATLEDPTAVSPQPKAMQPKATQPKAIPIELDPERSRVHADLDLAYRQKGLLWYSTYQVQFAGSYAFRNPADQVRIVHFTLLFPAQQAVYDDLWIAADGRPLPFSANQTGASAWVTVPAGQSVVFRAAYRSRGLASWRYSFGKDVSRTRDFELTLSTNFKDIDFPPNTLSPVDKQETTAGWDLKWNYRNLISGFEIGMAMPEKLQPGPLAGEISAFAPVSLLLFFFVIFIVTTLRKLELHAMNYFFLAAAFFSFHLLLAYSVDHISIGLAFALSSFVSVGLVVSYLRLAVGPRFAIKEAGLAQFVYLVLFSFSFFLKGFTGLSITIGCIVTLFIAMQATARLRWREQFASNAVRT